jgi:hypothetical protein
MKPLKFILIASLALASSFTASAEVSAQASFETYYLNPRPATVPAMMRALSRERYFEQPGHIAVGIGFFATVFAQNPDRVDEWVSEIRRLPGRDQRMLAAALWQANYPAGRQLMRELSEETPFSNKIKSLTAVQSRTVSETSVLSTSSMNLQWGAFLASGDERYMINIFNAIGLDQPGLDNAARAALARHVADHPRVMEICIAQLDRQPAEVQSVLRAAVSGVTAKPSI